MTTGQMRQIGVIKTGQITAQLSNGHRRLCGAATLFRQATVAWNSNFTIQQTGIIVIALNQQLL